MTLTRSCAGIALIVCLSDGPRAMAQRPPDMALTATINRAVVEGVIGAVHKYYFSVEGGANVERVMRAQLQAGAYDRITSAFVDVQTNVYTGHRRTSQDWTAGVEGDLGFFWNVQLNLGIQLHAGR